MAIARRRNSAIEPQRRRACSDRPRAIAPVGGARGDNAPVCDAPIALSLVALKNAARLASNCLALAARLVSHASLSMARAAYESS
jgi:hypothetical protein